MADERTKFFKDLGKRISDLRKKQGLSQEALAAKICIDRVAVGYIEQGRRKPSLNTVYSISRELKVPVAEMFKRLK